MVELNCCRQAPNPLCCRTRRSNPLTDKPARERHFLSMGASISSVVLLVISLALPWWATANVKNRSCSFGLIKVSCIHPLSGEYRQDMSCKLTVSLASTDSDIIIIISSLCYSEWILRNLTADTDLVCSQHQCAHYDILTDSSIHQCWFPSREVRVSSTLFCLQHSLLWVSKSFNVLREFILVVMMLVLWFPNGVME